jgi:hypothetical protein
MKLVELETTDGRGLIAYAGLGATARRTQPSEWISAVLRGRGGLPFEQTLGFLANAAQRELPRHLARMPGGAHFMVVPAFLRGVGPRLYSIDNALDPTTNQHYYRFTSHQRTADPGSPSVRMALAGTGGAYLAQKASEFKRDLFSLVKAHDKGRVSDQVVADRLAHLNNRAHLGVRDKTVGPRCIVVWRRRQDARRPGPGGAHQCYTAGLRDANSGSIPAILSGLDARAISDVLMGQLQQRLSDPATQDNPFGGTWEDKLKTLVGGLPSDPDDRLR